jgi:hypothetical protein
MSWAVGAVALLLAAAVAGGYLGPRWRRSRQVVPAYDHFRCPGCKRRLRYLAQKAGHRGRCPTCKRDLTFPGRAGPPFARPAVVRHA